METRITPHHPDPDVIVPNLAHTSTLILLHGTSTSGLEFLSYILSFPIPLSSDPASSTNTNTNTNTSTSTLRHLFPHTKLVFPTGSPKPVTVFGGRETNAWFDIHSFSDRTIGEADQIPGLRDSVGYLKRLIEEEIDVLVNGKTGWSREEAGKRVVVWGFSQGGAVVGILELSGVVNEVGLGGLVGMSAWLPFRRQIEEAAREGKREGAVKFVRGLLGLKELEGGGELRTPMLLCHGEEDQKVKLEWGCEMRDLMLELGIDLSFKSYKGLEHWYNEDEMRDIVLFIRGIWGDREKEDALGGVVY
jgi:predicted esterase